MALVGQTLYFHAQNKRYLLQASLGSGATAETFRALALDDAPETLVAIKVSRPDLPSNLRARFREEAQTLSRWRAHIDTLKALLDDRNPIPEYYGMEEDAPEPFIIEEYLAGKSIPKLLAESDNGALDEVTALRISYQFVAVLKMLHDEMKQTYTDMKIDNIRWADNGIKVLDWNVLGDDLENGVPQDLFRFGAFMYQMLTGKSLTIQEGRRVELLKSSKRWDTLSFGWQEILEKALHTNPAKRYERAAELMQAVNVYLRLFDITIEKLENDGHEHFRKDRFSDALRYLDLAVCRQRWNGVMPSESLVNLRDRARTQVRADVENNLAAGIGFFRGWTYEKSANSFAQVISIDPEDIRALRWQCAARAGLDNPGSFRAMTTSVEAALEKMQAGYYDMAESTLRTLADDQSLSPGAQIQMNRLWAEAFIRNAVQQAQTSEDLGEGHRQAADAYNQAADKFDQVFANSIGSNSTDAFAQLLKWEFGDLHKKALAQRTLAETREKTGAAFKEIEQALQDGQYDQALEILRERIKNDRQNLRVHQVCLATGKKLLYEQSEFVRARKFFELLLDVPSVAGEAIKEQHEASHREDIAAALERKEYIVALDALCKYDAPDAWVNAMRAKASQAIQTQYHSELIAHLHAQEFVQAQKKIDLWRAQYGKLDEWMQELADYQHQVTQAHDDYTQDQNQKRRVRELEEQRQEERWTQDMEAIVARAENLVAQGTVVSSQEAQKVLDEALTPRVFPKALELYKQLSGKLEKYNDLVQKYKTIPPEPRVAHNREAIAILRQIQGLGFLGLRTRDDFDEQESKLRADLRVEAQQLLRKIDETPGLAQTERVRLVGEAQDLDPQAVEIHHQSKRADQEEQSGDGARADTSLAIAEENFANASTTPESFGHSTDAHAEQDADPTARIIRKRAQRATADAQSGNQSLADVNNQVAEAHYTHAVSIRERVKEMYASEEIIQTIARVNDKVQAIRRQRKAWWLADAQLKVQRGIEPGDDDLIESVLRQAGAIQLADAETDKKSIDMQDQLAAWRELYAEEFRALLEQEYGLAQPDYAKIKETLQTFLDKVRKYEPMSAIQNSEWVKRARRNAAVLLREANIMDALKSAENSFEEGNLARAINALDQVPNLVGTGKWIADSQQRYERLNHQINAVKQFQERQSDLGPYRYRPFDDPTLDLLGALKTLAQNVPFVYLHSSEFHRVIEETYTKYEEIRVGKANKDPDASRRYEDLRKRRVVERVKDLKTWIDQRTKPETSGLER